MLAHTAGGGLDELLHVGGPRDRHEVVRLADFPGEVEPMPGVCGHLHGEDGPHAVHGRIKGRRFGEIAHEQVGAELFNSACARRARVAHQGAHWYSPREQGAGGRAALTASGTRDKDRCFGSGHERISSVVTTP